MARGLYPTSCVALCWGAMLATLLCAAPAAAVKLRVRGSTELDVRAVRRDSGVEVRGVLSDDSGRPIGGAQVRVSPPANVTLPLPSPCRSTTPENLRHSRDVVVVDTDGAGAFCFLLRDEGLNGELVVRFEGDKFFDRLEQRVKVNSDQRSLGLSFTPEPRVLSLDRAEQILHVETRVDPPFDAADRSDAITLGVQLLEGDEARDLGEINLSPGDRGSLRLKSKTLGAPGSARLRVRFLGSRTLSSAETLTHVHKTARVSLTLAQDVAAVRSGEQAVVRIAASSVHGAVQEGAIEVLAGQRSLGTAPVENGAAVWSGPILANEGSLLLSVRYLPAAPWWLASDPIQVSMEVRPPAPWRSLPWLLGAAAVAAWVLRGWRRPMRPASKPAPAAATGQPSVEVVVAGKARSGWRGAVLDAHEGVAIVGAEVRIVMPSFEGSAPSASTITDEQGRFELPHCNAGEGSELRCDAPLHSSLRRAVPPAGQVVIRMVSRRRALLTRLVDWAKRKGPPYQPEGDPTPAQVAEVAGDRRDEVARRWARDVERAAFGPASPDAAEEARIRQAEPGSEGPGRER
ncbi:MAG: hypothetical protein R3B13_37705 [Polyangiaceae bacterium]